MILIGAGQAPPWAHSPPPASPASRQRTPAPPPLVNVAYRLGGWLGLGILVTVFAAADTATFDPPHLFAHRVAVSLPVSAGMLAVALVLVLTLIVRGRRTTDVAGHRPVSQAASRA